MLLEVTRSIHGAWRIARLDPAALQCFNLSIDGFWRSFVAIALVGPFFLGFLVLNYGHQTELHAPVGQDAGLEAYLFVKMITFAAAWLTFPMIMVLIARLLDLSGTYVQYIIVWNWSNVLVMAVVLPTVLMFPPVDGARTSGAMVLMAVQITTMFYSYLVARAGLMCKPLTAIGIVIIDFLLSLLFNGLANKLL